VSSDEKAPAGSILLGPPIARTVNSVEFAGPTPVTIAELEEDIIDVDIVVVDGGRAE
jgi:hypothetical protein